MEIPEEAAGAGAAIRFDENSSTMGRFLNKRKGFLFKFHRSLR